VDGGVREAGGRGGVGAALRWVSSGGCPRASHVRELLGWVPELRSRHMFGGVGLYSGERFFAILTDDTLYLKADDASRPLFRDGAAEAFGYLRQGKSPARWTTGRCRPGSWRSRSCSASAEPLPSMLPCRRRDSLCATPTVCSATCSPLALRGQAQCHSSSSSGESTLPRGLFTAEPPRLITCV